MKTEKDYKEPKFNIVIVPREDIITSSAWEVTGVDLGDLGEF